MYTRLICCDNLLNISHQKVFKLDEKTLSQTLTCLPRALDAGQAFIGLMTPFGRQSYQWMVTVLT